jgi:hypothetical protein
MLSTTSRAAAEVQTRASHACIGAVRYPPIRSITACEAIVWVTPVIENARWSSRRRSQAKRASSGPRTWTAPASASRAREPGPSTTAGTAPRRAKAGSAAAILSNTLACSGASTYA